MIITNRLVDVVKYITFFFLLGSIILLIEICINGELEYIGYQITSLITMYILYIILGSLLAGLPFELIRKTNIKRTEELRIKVKQARDVICEGSSSITKGLKTFSMGWMFASKEGIEYYPFKAWKNAENIAIPSSKIENVKNMFNKIEIQTSETTYSFKVEKPRKWVKFLNDIVCSKEHREI